ncbi:MAG: class I SAM-dependent methyltransferase, partial [Bdellovibrionota bacterium]
MNDTSYLCPITKKSLVATKSGLINAEGRVFPYIGTSSTGNPIPDFVTSGMPAEGEFESRKMYCDPQAAKRYDNYLDWLFETFGQNESELRALMASRLRVKKGGRVLVVGCGLGDDLPAIASMVGETGRIYAQDLSPEMVLEADARLKSGATRVPFSGDIDQI